MPLHYSDVLRTALALRGHSLVEVADVPHVQGRDYRVLTLTFRSDDGTLHREADVFPDFELRDPEWLRLWVRCHYPDRLSPRALVSEGMAAQLARVSQ